MIQKRDVTRFDWRLIGRNLWQQLRQERMKLQRRWMTVDIFWRKTALADSLDVAKENRRERNKGQLLGFQLE